MTRKAVVLLSGGLDSATVLGIAHKHNYEIHAISFHYNQRHSHEIKASRRLVSHYQVHKHIEFNLDCLKQIGGSALTDESIKVPTYRSTAEMSEGIPSTYVPGRNIIFLSIASSYAEVNECSVIFTGVNALDYSGYPDCRPEFINAFQQVIEVGTAMGSDKQKETPTILTPLIDLTKADIIKRGSSLGVPYEITHSCYNPDERGRACGHCDSCLLRKKGFAEAQIADPTIYVD